MPLEVFGPGWQGVWVSDAYCSQRRNGATWQMCLAHLLHDTQCVVDCGDTEFSQCLQKLLLRAIIISRRRPDLTDDQLALRYAELHRRLDRILDCTPASPEARRLHRRLIRDREHLVVFMKNRDVPPTNNISERQLRPSVIFRKVTNGFREEWGSETHAAFLPHRRQHSQTNRQNRPPRHRRRTQPRSNPQPGVSNSDSSFLKKRSKRFLPIAASISLNADAQVTPVMGKSFLVLFLKKEVLPSSPKLQNEIKSRHRHGFRDSIVHEETGLSFRSRILFVILEMLREIRI